MALDVHGSLVPLEIWSMIFELLTDEFGMPDLATLKKVKKTCRYLESAINTSSRLLQTIQLQPSTFWQRLSDISLHEEIQSRIQSFQIEGDANKSSTFEHTSESEEELVKKVKRRCIRIQNAGCLIFEFEKPHIPGWLLRTTLQVWMGAGRLKVLWLNDIPLSLLHDFVKVAARNDTSTHSLRRLNVDVNPRDLAPSAEIVEEILRGFEAVLRSARDLQSLQLDFTRLGEGLSAAPESQFTLDASHITSTSLRSLYVAGVKFGGAALRKLLQCNSGTLQGVSFGTEVWLKGENECWIEMLKFMARFPFVRNSKFSFSVLVDERCQIVSHYLGKEWPKGSLRERLDQFFTGKVAEFPLNEWRSQDDLSMAFEIRL